MQLDLSQTRYRPTVQCLCWVFIALCLSVSSLKSQEPPPIYPTGTAVMSTAGMVTTLPFTVAPAGPLLRLQPICERLGVELRIGPLGDSHTLVLDDQQVIFGPDSAVVIWRSADGAEQQQQLTQAPRRALGGLEVPLELLERTLGERLGYDFLWDSEQLELTVVRRQRRLLQAEATLVHQFGVTTVEIRFSQQPRYRTEISPGQLDILLLGDQLDELLSVSTSEGSWVEGVEALGDRLRIRLARDAVASEARLIQSPTPRLIVEIFRQAPQALVNLPRSQPRRRSPDLPGIRTIVLDPGHGGGESGAVAGSGTAEKDLVLTIARLLERRLESRLPVRVELTRNRDVEMLHESRTALANQNKADLFISLHLNASFGARAHGAETYFLSREASDQLAAEAAAAENRHGGGGAERDLQLILWDLAQSHHLAESQRFAKLVQEELNQTLGLRDRGVKQAPFRVLMGANMPAVLVELGFLSNPREETKLQDPRYRQELVDALVRAVTRFKRQIDTRLGLVSADEDSTAEPAVEEPSL